MVDNASIGLYENSRFVHHEELPTIIGHMAIGTWAVMMTVTFMGGRQAYSKERARHRNFTNRNKTESQFC